MIKNYFCKLMLKISEIRLYKVSDRNRCLEIFDSNYPKFFAAEEKILFANWLDKENREEYYILTVGDITIACGGIYFDTKENLAGLAWGMVHNAFHKQGYGRRLTAFRIVKLNEQFPGITHKVETSQHTFVFYELMGFKISAVIKNGFAVGLDKYVMIKSG